MNKPTSLVESAMMEVTIPGTKLKAPFLVIGLMTAAIIGGSFWIYAYNQKTGV